MTNHELMNDIPTFIKEGKLIDSVLEEIQTTHYTTKITSLELLGLHNVMMLSSKFDMPTGNIFPFQEFQLN